MTSHRALRWSIRRLETLDEPSRDELWQLYQHYYCGTSRDYFMHDLQDKHHVIVLRQPQDGSLRGFSTLRCYQRQLEGRRFSVVYSGDTVVDQSHWGDKGLHQAFTLYVALRKLAHPRLPLYWFLLTKGYRTYLLLSRNFINYWPRHDRQTPPFQEAVLDLLASETFGERWDPSTGIVRHTGSSGRLRHDVAPIGPQQQRRPDIAYFLRRNPGHAEGDELCCLGLVSASSLVQHTGKLARTRLRKWTRRLRS